MHGISKPMKVFLEKLRSVDIRGKKVFAFDTKVKAWWAGSAGKGIENKLKKMRMSVVKPHSSAIVTGSEGPLEERMEEMLNKSELRLQNQFNELLKLMMVGNNKKDYRSLLHVIRYRVCAREFPSHHSHVMARAMQKRGL